MEKNTDHLATAVSTYISFVRPLGESVAGRRKLDRYFWENFEAVAMIRKIDVLSLKNRRKEVMPGERIKKH